MVTLIVEVGAKVGPAAAVSDVSERCSRRGLNSRPLLEGLLSSLSLSSVVGKGVDLTSGVLVEEVLNSFGESIIVKLPARVKGLQVF